jgi:hypothetical protein
MQAYNLKEEVKWLLKEAKAVNKEDRRYGEDKHSDKLSQELAHRENQLKKKIYSISIANISD